MQSSLLESIPREILGEIGFYCSGNDLCNIKECCKTLWKRIHQLDLLRITMEWYILEEFLKDPHPMYAEVPLLPYRLIMQFGDFTPNLKVPDSVKEVFVMDAFEMGQETVYKNLMNILTTASWKIIRLYCPHWILSCFNHLNLLFTHLENSNRLDLEIEDANGRLGMSIFCFIDSYLADELEILLKRLCSIPQYKQELEKQNYLLTDLLKYIYKSRGTQSDDFVRAWKYQLEMIMILLSFGAQLRIIPRPIIIRYLHRTTIHATILFQLIVGNIRMETWKDFEELLYVSVYRESWLIILLQMIPHRFQQEYAAWVFRNASVKSRLKRILPLTFTYFPIPLNQSYYEIDQHGKRKKRSLLMKVVDHKNEEWVDLLLNNGADINYATENYQNTVLHYAYYHYPRLQF